MPVGPDETEQLLARLEAELSGHEQVVGARKAREQAAKTALEDEIARCDVMRDENEAALADATPRRNTMIVRRDELRLNGSKGNRGRATLWAGANVLLVLGATIPLSLFSGKTLLFAVLFGELLALGLGYALSALFNRSPE